MDRYRMKKSVSRIAYEPYLQPRGGFLRPRDMVAEDLDNDKKVDYPALINEYCENGKLLPQIRGLVIDYLLRVELDMALGLDYKNAIVGAFNISLLGVKMVGKMDVAKRLLNKLGDEYKKTKDRDYKKIVKAASELVVFDAVVRAGYYDQNAPKPKVNDNDVESIMAMLKVTKEYLLNRQKIVSLGPVFNAFGAEYVLPSDADLLTKDSLIDIKCSKKKPTAQQTFQLLLYYILGMHEDPVRFTRLKYLKIVNPRLGRVFSYKIEDIQEEYLKHVEKYIMGYSSLLF